MDLVDLLERYAEVNTMQLHDAWIAWDEGAIDKFDLMEAYLESEVRAAAQGDGVLAFTCTELPEIDLEANVMVIVQGVTA